MAWPYFDDDSIARALAAAGRPLLPRDPAAPVQLPDPTPQWVRDATPADAPGLQPNLPADPSAQGAAPMVPPGSPYAADPNEIQMSGDEPEPPPGPPLPAPRAQFAPVQGPADVSGTQANEAAAIQRMGDTATQIANQTLAAQGASFERQAGAVDQAGVAKAKLDADYQTARATAREEAAAETMKWMGDLEANAAKEPNQHRYWQSQGSFGKGLWLLSMGLSLASQVGQRGAGMQANPIIEMLRAEVRTDVEAQKERLARERENLIRRGDIMQRGHASKLEDIKDDHTLEAERWLALKEAAKLRASAPGPDDHKLALMAGQKVIDEELVKVMGRRADQARSSREAVLDRNFRAGQAQLDRDSLWDRQTREINKDYNLARIEAEAKTGGGGFEAKDLRTISRNTGFRIVDGKGKELSEIRVPKEQHKEVAEAIDNSVRQSRLLQRLRSSYAKSTTAGRTLKNDAELVALIEGAAGARAKELNSGALSEADRAVGYKNLLGVDYNSLLSRLKGPNKAETMAWLDKQIQHLPASAAETVTAKSGISLPAGARVAYTPTEVEDAPDPTAESAQAEAGLKPRPVEVPIGANAVREAKAAGALPELPSALGSHIEKVEALAGRTMSRNAQELAARANQAIDAWEAKHAEAPNAKAQARHARDRVFVATQDAMTGGKVDREEKVQAFVGPTTTVTEAQKIGERYGIDLTAAEAADLIKAAKTRAKALRDKLGGDKLPGMLAPRGWEP